MTDNNDDYRPIDCGVYSGYELAIMHRDRLQVHWRDEVGMDHIERLRPLDLKTRNGQEFMIVETLQGERREIRLDRIIAAEKVVGEGPP